MARSSECVMVSSDERPLIAVNRLAAPPCNCSCGGPPRRTLRVTGAERLHRRLLRREAAGKMDRRHAAASAVRDFAGCENAVHEPLAIPLDRGSNAFDV